MAWIQQFLMHNLFRSLDKTAQIFVDFYWLAFELIAGTRPFAAEIGRGLGQQLKLDFRLRQEAMG